MHIQGYFILPFIPTKNVNRIESTELLEPPRPYITVLDKKQKQKQNPLCFYSFCLSQDQMNFQNMFISRYNRDY